MLCRCKIAATILLLGGSHLLAQAPQEAVEGPRPPALRKLQRKLEQRKAAASPTALLERLQKMTPEEREGVFKALPEQRQEAARRRFDAFNRLSAEERDRLGENLLAFLSLGPQRQELARAIFRRFAGVAKDRQDAMQAEMKLIATLSPEDRRSRINTDEFRNRFSADEKVLMFDMLRIFPGRRAAETRAVEQIQQQ